MGSLYAALLKEAGEDVSLLARGKRLQNIREQGIVLEEFGSGRQTTTHVKTVASLEPEDAYELVLVFLPRNHVREALPILARNQQTPSVMFLGNNAAGAEEMVEALGQARVLLGFPGAAAVPHNNSIRYLILAKQEQPTTIGELDGSRSPRIRSIANTFRSAGFPVSICANMDAWLKTHVAEISPTGNALYMVDLDIQRLAHTRDALLLMLRAIREGYKVLSKIGVPITPKKHLIFQWLPEPLLLVLMRRMLEDRTASIKIGHAVEARDEMQTLADEFRKLIQKANIYTPSIDKLYRYLDEQTEPATDSDSSVK
ncbi:MAG: ketopantoate reductase family protein [Planctomycetes bacterium]|nr:ketopantoate reductase family protein [Planctomycetota bacterium]MCH9725704.1 ketopantoate reductase family protein [Planctomycetota bacterium]MCH9777759.1 ketopantoate reductase family protein [Planctomycetota bacterium]MCH9791211.1 ketopantoate reductase family protein [Planctomycetota bacterium]